MIVTDMMCNPYDRNGYNHNMHAFLRYYYDMRAFCTLWGNATRAVYERLALGQRHQGGLRAAGAGATPPGRSTSGWRWGNATRTVYERLTLGQRHQGGLRAADAGATSPGRSTSGWRWGNATRALYGRLAQRAMRALSVVFRHGLVASGDCVACILIGSHTPVYICDFQTSLDL